MVLCTQSPYYYLFLFYQEFFQLVETVYIPLFQFDVRKSPCLCFLSAVDPAAGLDPSDHVFFDPHCSFCSVGNPLLDAKRNDLVQYTLQMR